MLKKIIALVNEEGISLRERLFRLVLLVGTFTTLFAILAGFLLKNTLRNTLPLLGILLLLVTCSYFTFFKRKLVFAISFFATVLVVVIFPTVFFTSGGVDGGAGIWMVLGILYIFVMLNNREQRAFLVLAVFVDMLTYILAYLHPDWVIGLSSRKEIFYDSFSAIIMVGFAVGLVIRYQIILYEKESQLTRIQQEKISQISKSKDAFFTNMSHELRTPINTIIGLNEMVLREDISDEVAEDAVNIQDASQLLLSLVNDILDFSQLENHKMVLVPVAYSTKSLFQAVVDLIRIRLKEKDLKFYVNVDSQFPSELYGDDKRLKQVLLNLLSNAVKYTREGSVTLNAQCEILDDETIRMTVDVVDTGIGIKKEDLEGLYQSFIRVDREENRSVEGSGLGLSIVKQLLHLMDGRITVDSIYTKGTTFTVVLDQQIVNPEPLGFVDFLGTDHLHKRKSYERSFEAPEANVLIVDDNEANLMVAAKLLRDTRVKVDTVTSGEKCLECTRHKSYHVILLDSMMQGMDGIQTLKEIRRQENGLCSKAPVVALTANAGVLDEKRYLDYGFDGYLAKPVEGARLEAEILKFLPDEIVEFRLDQSDRSRQNEEIQRLLNRKRKKVLITTDSASDLPKEMVEEFDIKVMYMYAKTETGVFQDSLEVDSDNLYRYMSARHADVIAVSASVEEYEAFYADALTEAENVIHISMGKNAGKSYSCAYEAAQGFGHVHVVDSGHISGGEGLLVLYAARLVREGKNTEEILDILKDSIPRTCDAYLMPDVSIFYQNGHTNRLMKELCDRAGLHPAIRFRQSAPRIKGVYAGRLPGARKRFIRRILHKNFAIDSEIVYITHVGCGIKEQREIVDEVLKCIPFKHYIIQKSSVVTSCNSGRGTIGIAYYKYQDVLSENRS